MFCGSIGGSADEEERGKGVKTYPQEVGDVPLAMCCTCGAGRAVQTCAVMSFCVGSSCRWADMRSDYYAEFTPGIQCWQFYSSTNIQYSGIYNIQGLGLGSYKDLKYF